MSGALPLVIQTTPIDQSSADLCALVQRLAQHGEHRLRHRFPQGVAQLIPGATPQHDRALPMGLRYPSLREAAQACPWLRIDGLVSVGALNVGATLRWHPAAFDDTRPAVALELDGSLYDAIYPDMSRRRSFNMAQKHALIRLCASLADSAGAAGFVLRQSGQAIAPTEAAELRATLLGSFLDSSALVCGMPLDQVGARPPGTTVALGRWLLRDHLLP